MKTTTLVSALAVMPLSFVLVGSVSVGATRTKTGSTQGKRTPAVELPKSKNSMERAETTKGSFIVSVSQEGEYYVAGRRLVIGALAAAVRDGLSASPPDEQTVYLRCEASLKFGAVRQVLNAIRQVGFDRVQFAVEVEESRREAFIQAEIFMPNGIKVDSSDFIDVPPRPRETTRNAPPPPPPPPPPPSPPPHWRGRVAMPIGPFNSDSLVVEVKSGGAGPDQAVALNTRIMPLEKLLPSLSGVLETRPNKEVFVKPSRDRSYSDVIAVMDEINGAGADTLLLLIDEVEVPSRIPGPGRRPPMVKSDAQPGGGGVASGVVGGVPGGVPDELPRIIRKSGVALRDSATRRVEPKTPPLARAAKVTGAVVVEVIVGEQGNVISARAISGHPLLKDAAVDAARGWRFTPTRLSGEPIKVIGTLTFTFKE